MLLCDARLVNSTEISHFAQIVRASRFLRFNRFQSSRKNMGCITKWRQIKYLQPASVSRLGHDSSDARGREEKNLDNDRPVLARDLPANALDLFLTVLTQKVEAHAVTISLFH